MRGRWFSVLATGPSPKGDKLSDQKPIVYIEDGFTNYRASSLTMCPRAFIHARQGYPPLIPPKLQEAFDYGTEHESEVLGMLMARGYELEALQETILLPVISGATNARIVGHIDGASVPHLVEVKCLNHENTELFRDNPDNFPYYVAQVSSYVHGWNRVHHPDRELNSVLFAIYDKDEKELHEVYLGKDELLSVESLALLVGDREFAWTEYQLQDEMPTCIKSNSFCPYFHLHEESDVISDPTLENLLVVYEALDGQIKKLSRLQEEAKKRIKDYLSDGSAPAKGVCGGFRYSYSEYSSNRLNTQAASTYLKDVGKYNDYLKVIPSTRLSVERVEDPQ